MSGGPLRNVVDFLQKTERKMFEGIIWFHSIGHMITENDWVSRIALSDSYFIDHPGLVFHKPNEFSDFIQLVFAYSNVPIQIMQTPNALDIQVEIARAYPELTVKSGFWSFTKRPGPPSAENNFRFFWTAELTDPDETSRARLLLLRKTKHINIWTKYIDEVLLKDSQNDEFLCMLRRKPYVAVQIRYDTPKNMIIRNGTGSAQVVFPEDLVPLFEYLCDRNVHIIQVGREELPDQLKKFGIFHYPSSKFCSVPNDFILARLSKSALIFASGLNHVYDLVGNSYVSVNHWDMTPNSSASGAFLPARLVENASGRLLTFAEQSQAWWEIALAGSHGSFRDQKIYSAIRTPPEAFRECFVEVLEPSVETLKMSNDIWLEAKALDPRGLWPLSECRLPICVRNFFPDYI